MRKISKLALFNIVISVIGLIIIIVVNPLIKPFYEFKYEIETDRNFLNIEISQSEFQNILYESYERIGIYLNQENLLGDFMNLSSYIFEDKFYISYEQLGQNKKKIENIEFINFFLGILERNIKDHLIPSIAELNNRITEFNNRKEYLVNLCSKIHLGKIELNDNELEKLMFSMMINNYGDSLYIRLKDCKTELEYAKINNLINDILIRDFIPTKNFSLNDLDQLNIEFSFREISNSKSVDFKNILFLYIVALFIINLIILLSIKVSKR